MKRRVRMASKPTISGVTRERAGSRRSRWWAVLERGTDAVVSQRDQIEGRVAYVDPLAKGRSAPAEGTTIWVVRPRLRAADLRPPRIRVVHTTQPNDAGTTVNDVSASNS